MKKSVLTSAFALAVILTLLSTGISDANVRLPRIFSSHMVLQQEAPIPVWGWANPGERVTVTLDKILTADGHRPRRKMESHPPRP